MVDRELLQLNTTFTVLSRETVKITYDKNYILTMLHLRSKISFVRWID